MFMPDTWKLPPEIAPEWLWWAFLLPGLAVSLIPLLVGIKIYRSIEQAHRVIIFAGVGLSLLSGSFVASCRPVIAKGWQWVLDKTATLPSVSESGTSFMDAVIPFVVNGLGVAMVLFILYVVMEEF